MGRQVTLPDSDAHVHSRRPLTRFTSWIRRLLEWLLEASFRPPRSRLEYGFAALWYLALLLAGAFLWWYLLNGGAIQLNLHDWVEASKRYAFLQDAVRQGMLPLHMPGTSALRGVTDRFLAVVDTNTSPQVLLLAFLSIGQFIVANTLILYLIGFGLTLGLAHRLRLSPALTTGALLLLFFNGHVTAHVAVGHVHWAAYMLVPGFILLAIEILRGRDDWITVMLGAAWMLVVMLQGAYHLVVLSIVFLLLLIPAAPHVWRPVSKVIVAGLLLSMVRIAPPLLESRNFDTEFLSGFITAFDLLPAQVVIKPPIRELVFSNNPLSPLGWWELDYYVGLVGLSLALGVGAGGFLIWRAENKELRALMVPITVMTLFSIGRLYKIFHVLAVPLLSTQRVSSRLYFLPLAFLVVLGCLQLQSWLSRSPRSNWVKIGGIGLLVLLAHDLWQHLKLWRVVRMGELFPPTPLDLELYFVANHPDASYVGATLAGAAITLLTAVVLGLLAARRLHQLRRCRSRADA